MTSPLDIPAETLVEAFGVGKRYGTTVALDEVTMTIREGCSVALAGRNGAGKSTMVRLLTGLDKPDTGEIRFSGAPAPDVSARAAWRSRVACVYQKSTIIPNLSVGENLFLNDQPGPGIGAIRWKEVRRLTQEALETWGLDISPDQRAGDLTVGQRQLLEIARALRQGSRFVILDEPTARLEGREIRQLFEHVNRLKATGVTFLFISHHLQEIYEICEQVVVMRDGRLVADAPVGELDHNDLVAAMVGDAYDEMDGPSQGVPVSAPAAEADRPIVLDVQNLAVEGVFAQSSIRIHAGERVGLAGLGGSGKTEFAQAIVGRMMPSFGTVTVSGRKLKPGRVDHARDNGVGYVPEDRHADGFCNNLSVEENIALPVLHRMSWLGFISSRRRRALANSMINELQIKVSNPDQLASQLSGGNQQKTVMARALSSNPEVLVLGYPTAGVDIASKQALFETIRQAQSAVLLVSDEIDELAICDRVLVMFDGRIVREFTGAWEEQEMVAAIEGVGKTS